MSNEKTNGWVDVCAVDDVPVLGSRILPRASGSNVAIFRNADDEIFALNDRCPHKGGPLSQGIVFGRKVACPLHNWNIDLENGCALAPDVGAAATFACKVENGRILLGDQKSEHVAAVLANKRANDAPATAVAAEAT